MPDKLEINQTTRSRTRTRQVYDRLSHWYDLLTGKWEYRLTEVAIERLEIYQDESLIELGFGTGKALLPLIHFTGTQKAVVGVDLSQGMIKRANKRLIKNKILDRAHLACGDALYLPLKNSTFDALLISFTLELFDNEEIPGVLEDIRRVLKPNGRIAVVSLSKEGRDTWMRSLYEWGHCHFPGLLDCRPIYLSQAMEAAGFGIISSELVRLFGLPVEITIGRCAK